MDWMERNLERSVRGYIGSVKKSLVCNGVQKKRVAAEIEDDIYAYAEENSVSRSTRSLRISAHPRLLQSLLSIPARMER